MTAKVEFRSYVSKPPTGEWAYVVDDFGTVFGPGWWPFYHQAHANAKPVPSSVRLAPNVRYESWNQEYVTVYQRADGTCWLILRVFVRPQGMGGMVYDGVVVDLHIQTGTFAYREEPDEEFRSALDEKVAKIHALIHESRSLRRKGMEAAPTAYAAWMAHKEDTA